MSDVEANEAVMNKNWYRQVADAEAPRLQSKMGVSTRLHMTRPQWVQQRLQSEAALWSSKKDDGPGMADSSHSAPSDEDQLPLHAMLQPSMGNIETFLADEAKEMELLAAHHLLTMSQSKPSPGMTRLPLTRNFSVRMKSTIVWLKSKRPMKRMKMRTIGGATTSSSTDPSELC